MLPFYITKTLAIIKTEIAGLTPVSASFDYDTTLNYKYSLFNNIPPEDSTTLKYFGIGVNGCRYVDEHNTLIPYVPEITDMDLYTPLPFRCVPITNDLTPVERANYRMRVLQNIKGVDYFCYYLKLIDITTPDVIFTETDLETGDETILTLDNANLNPSPNELVVVGVLDVSKEGSAYVEGTITITGAEVLEAINIMYDGDITKANISEIGLYSGEDKEVTSDITYNESMYTQLAVHKCFNNIDFSSASTIQTSNIRLLASANFIL